MKLILSYSLVFYIVCFLSSCNKKEQNVQVLVMVNHSYDSVFNQNVFDNNENTFWQNNNTIENNDEIAIKFEQPVFIDEIRLIQKTNNSDSILKFKIGINNHLNIFEANKPILINQKTDSLNIAFFKIKNSKGLIGYINGNQYFINNSYDNKIAVSEIAFFRKGQKIEVTCLNKYKSSLNKPEIAYNHKILKSVIKNPIRNIVANIDGLVFDKIIHIKKDGTFYIKYFELKSNRIEIEKKVTGLWKIKTNQTQKTLVQFDGLCYIVKNGKTTINQFQDLVKITDNEISGNFSIDSFFLDFPKEAFVDLNSMNENFSFEIRYATTNNFTEQILYDCPKCLLRYDMAKALVIANRNFQKDGYHIKFFDCYRPLSVQRRLWEIKPNPVYVANPDKGSEHNRGTAVDLTIVDQNGNEMNMGTEYDYFGEKAFTINRNLPEEILKNRDYFIKKMKEQCFTPSLSEWWHFFFPYQQGYEMSDFKWICD